MYFMTVHHAKNAVAIPIDSILESNALQAHKIKQVPSFNNRMTQLSGTTHNFHSLKLSYSSSSIGSHSVTTSTNVIRWTGQESAINQKFLIF